MLCRLPRQIIVPKPQIVTVTITSGPTRLDYVYVQYNGTQYYKSGDTFTALSGETILLAVNTPGGIDTSTPYIKIDGVDVPIKTTSGEIEEYEWIIPEGITNVSMKLSRIVGEWKPIGQITVTTS